MTEMQTDLEPHSFGARFLGALKLDGNTFEAVERDLHALPQAAAVVVLGGLARGIGEVSSEPGSARIWVELIGSPLVGVIVWLVAATLIWGIGVRRFGYTSDYPELLRTLGFAAAPLVILVLTALPGGFVGSLIWVLAHGWATLALVVATRAALDVPSAQALFVCVLALAATLGALFVAGLLLVGGAASG
jgi:hypothetical protein